jgi:hypothetical protein
LGSPTSFAKRYQSLKKESASTLWFAAIDHSSVSLFSNPPIAGSKEKRFVQPWWTNVINNLPNTFKVTLVDEHGHQTIGEVQNIMEMECFLLLDTIGYISGKPRNPFYIAVIGENKGRREPGAQEEFNDEEKGQLAAYFDTLINQYQQHRKEITG